MYIFHMALKRRKIATNIPENLLREATSLTGLNQTAALVAGLKELIRQHKLQKLLALEGKIKINFDAAKSRERHIS